MISVCHPNISRYLLGATPYKIHEAVLLLNWKKVQGTSAFKVAFGSSRGKFICVLELFIQVGLLLPFATFPKGRHSFPQFTLAQEGL